MSIISPNRYRILRKESPPRSETGWLWQGVMALSANIGKFVYLVLVMVSVFICPTVCVTVL